MVQKQFGKYTITITTEHYAGIMYRHVFEVARSGTYERVLTEVVCKNKRPDIFRYFEDYYSYIDNRYWNTKDMTKDDWEDMIFLLDKEARQIKL